MNKIVLPKKQWNVGLVETEKVDSIDLVLDRAALRIREEVKAKIDQRQYAANIVDIYGETLAEWFIVNFLQNKETSWDASKKMAAKRVADAEVMKDIDTMLRDFFIELREMLKPMVMKALEEKWKEKYG